MRLALYERYVTGGAITYADFVWLDLRVWWIHW
jgi:hypothetical protein